MALLVVCAASPSRAQIPGFAGRSIEAQRALEDRFLSIPSDTSALRAVRWLAAAPHLAGTPEMRVLADSLAGLLGGLGFDVRIERFEPWLPHPVHVDVRMVAPEARSFAVREPPAGSGAADTAAVLWNWLAYAGNGTVEAPVVYVNYGLPDDYAALDRARIDVRGRIVLARLGRAFRGVKVAEAEGRGAAGVLLFPDPSGDGFAAGDTLPGGPFRPSWSVQRGTLMAMWRYTGDPLTPGRPAVAGEPRLDPSRATNLPRIPAATIGYADAQALLQRLDGAELQGFGGALPIRYRTGPGPARVRVQVEQSFEQRPIHNVIATLPGADTSRSIIIGNHVDAWLSGGADPHVGTAVVLEIARGLASLARDGWRPRRSLVIALWDAEEFGVIGSTEWVERHRERLSAGAVAYFNIDTYTAGTLDVTGSPALRDLVWSSARVVADPVTGRTLAEEWAARANSGERAPEIGDIGAGSDWTAFLHHAGVPSLQWTMNGRGRYAVYHSALDTHDYAAQFVDPGLKHAPALARVMGVAALRLAQADVLPFHYARYADRIERYITDRETQARTAGIGFDATELRVTLDRFRSAAGLADIRALNALSGIDTTGAATLDAVLPRVETAFLAEEGLPGRSWYRHPLNAPGADTGYDALPLPALAESIARRDGAAMRRAIRQVVESLRRAAIVLEGATGRSAPR